MGKNFRKRKADSDNEGEEEETAEERRKRLADLKAEQEARQKKKGVDAAKLLGAKLEEDKRGNVGAADDGGEGEGELRDNFYTEHVVEASEDPHMLKYIEEKLAEKRGAKAPPKKEEEQRKPEPDGRIREEDLYVTPDHLKIETQEATDTADRWLTGIIEVALPTEYRIKNMEETERAKQELLMKQIKKGETDALERMGIYKKPEVREDDRISRRFLPKAFGKGAGRLGPPPAPGGR